VATRCSPANTSLMNALSDGMKAMLGGMAAIHSAGRIYGVNPDRSLAGLPSSMTIRYTQEAHGETSTGPCAPMSRRTQVLYVNGNFTVRFKDMTRVNEVGDACCAARREQASRPTPRWSLPRRP